MNLSLRSLLYAGAASLAVLQPAHARAGSAAADGEAADAAADAVAAGADAANAGAASADAAAYAGADIIITATRRAESVQDVPTAVTVLDSDLFTVGGLGRSAHEVLSYVPNASAGTQQHGRPRWWIRGVGAGQQQLDLANPVGFYLDEVYISNASATGLPLFDLERVEVLRGPQGTLWGKNTTGGAIAVVSRRPTLTPGDADNYFKIDYGSFDDKIVEGAVGAVIVPDLLAGRISAHVENRDGRYRNQFTGERDNGIEDTLLRGQLLAAPAPDFEALLSVHYRRYKTDGTYWSTGSYAPDGVFRDGYVPSTDPDHVSTNADEFSDTEQYGGSLRLQWDIGDYSLTSITGYEKYDTVASSDNDYTPLEVARNHNDAESRQWTQEIRLASPQSDRLSWIVGLYYFNEKIDSRTWSATLPAGSVPSLPGPAAPAAYSLVDYDHKAESGAAFASLKFAVTDRFDITGGARWTRETKTLVFDRRASPDPAATSWTNLEHWWDSYTGTFGGPGTFGGTLKRSWDAFTYDVSPSWRFADDQLVYFKFAHGLKSGGFNTAAQLPVALQAVKPEKLDAFEVGYKSQWFNGRLTFNASAFHYEYDDVQINVVGPNPGAVGGATTSYLQNAARAHVDGAEFELVAEPIDGLNINAALGLLDTEYDELQVVNGGADLSGAEFVRAPHVTLNLGASYTFAVKDDHRLQVQADGRYQSLQHYYITPQDTVNRRFLSQPGYALVNARISYLSPDDRFTLSAYVNNLFDKTYRNHALPQSNPARGITGDTIQWGEPRTIGASLVARF